MNQHVPNRSAAIVEPGKLTDYLLSTDHPVGRNKARVFGRCGYDHHSIRDLVTELTRIVLTEPIVESVESAYGWKYIVDGVIPCSGGATLSIRTIWIVEAEFAAPRFVTAHPV